jgi:TPR repeat protein
MRPALALVFVAIVGCEPASPPSDVAPSGSAPDAAALPAATAAARAPQTTDLTPKKLRRKTTPAEVNAKLDAACTGGDGQACMKLADRQNIGCGVARKRPYPTLKQSHGDVDPDLEQYKRSMRRGCKLGVREACDARSFARVTAVYPFEKESRWKRPKADPFPPAIEACKKGKSCDRIYIALDRFGFTPTELAPIRASFAETLTEACLEGDCTCGDATQYIDESDERWLDLAILGCENGEAEGCYALARAFDTGRGVPKEAAKAAQLYDVACPPLVGRPSGDYSARACDHLAALAIGDSYPGNDRATAKHYAQAACRDPLHHAHCVRLGMLWATRKEAGRNAHEARMAAMGENHIGQESSYDNDCRRPSVAKECDELKETLKTARKE